MHDRWSPEDRRRLRTIGAFLAVCAAAVAAAVYLYLQPSVSDLPATSPSPSAASTK